VVINLEGNVHVTGQELVKNTAHCKVVYAIAIILALPNFRRRKSSCPKSLISGMGIAVQSPDLRKQVSSSSSQAMEQRIFLPRHGIVIKELR